VINTHCRPRQGATSWKGYFHAPQTNSRDWITAAGAAACLAALGALAMLIEASYRLAKREIRLYD